MADKQARKRPGPGVGAAHNEYNETCEYFTVCAKKTKGVSSPDSESASSSSASNASASNMKTKAEIYDVVYSVLYCTR